MPKRVVVGRIVKPHGIRGELIVESQTDAAAERFTSGARMFLGDPEGDPREVELIACRPHQGRFIVSLEGVADRTGAERYRNALLSILAAEAKQLAPGRYYPHELEGLTVVDEDGTALGTLAGVLDNPANDLWVVRTPEGRDVLVPAVREFIRDVSISAGRIVVRPIPGLFDEE